MLRMWQMDLLGDMRGIKYIQSYHAWHVITSPSLVSSKTSYSHLRCWSLSQSDICWCRACLQPWPPCPHICPWPPCSSIHVCISLCWAIEPPRFGNGQWYQSSHWLGWGCWAGGRACHKLGWHPQVVVTQFLVFIPITCLVVYVLKLKRHPYPHAPSDPSDLSDPSLPTPMFIRPQGYPNPDLKKPVPQTRVWVLSGQGQGRPPMTQGLPLTIPNSS